MRRAVPIVTVLLLIAAVWYLGAWRMNAPWALAQAERAGQEMTASELFTATMNQDRPRLPAPHQVAEELWKTTGEMALRGRALNKRSLIYHAGITLGATLSGFALGVTLGILGAVAITYSRVVEMSLMPWAIVSQTIPIVALAPMIIVLSNATGIEGRGVPKAIISAYLCYFPVLVGMVKGLNSPSSSQLDLLKTYNASNTASFFKLRLPASMPYLFTSLKIAIAAALVGTIVGELPTGAVSGLGARILIGDQFGTPLAIWAALFAAAILAGALVTLIGGVQGVVLKRMGMGR
ncbi:ABC transporter permease [Vannielia litorea]|uniref:NitT/TauT family transport system permease protein n=1 Tax=Vannielia litorea TaxID=1217970 RepID=A0A1N6G509_9RHOB|nr:ABC transporter permease subunit [Vannielia litorea]SIO02608.1 NitT/TauT family transport system permease protein [Vannielia litorea]